MSISVTCECGQQFETPAANAGDRVRCPDCGRELTVPKAAPPEGELLSWEDRSDGHQRQGDREPCAGRPFLLRLPHRRAGHPPRPPGARDIELSKGRLRGRWMAVAGIVLGVVGCLFTVALFLPAVRSAREAARRASAPITSSRSASPCTTTTQSTAACRPPRSPTRTAGRS